MNKPTHIEWIGGLTLLPVRVTPTSPQYQPEVLLWLTADGQVVGQALEPPGELLARASEHLRRSIAKPLDGPTPAPTRVRVASTELADALRSGHPSLQIVVAPTPEFDELVTALGEQLGDLDEGEGDDEGYLTSGLTPEPMAAFFHAAAELWRASPWTKLDSPCLQVSSKALGLTNCTLFLEEVPGETYGWLLFQRHEEFVAYFNPPEDDDPALPTLVLQYEDGEHLSDLMRDEVEEHQWLVPSPRAYPTVGAVDENGDPQAPTPQELQRAEGLCLALAALVENGTDHLSLKVKTHSGEVDFTLSTLEPEREPPEDDEELNGPADPDASHVLAKLFRLERQEEHHAEEVATLNEELLSLFQASPEAKGLGRVEFVRSLLDDAKDLFDMTVASLGPVELTELVLTERTIANPSTLKRVVAETRAFYSFLKREFGLRQADDCLLVVGEAAMAMVLGSSAPSVRRQSSEEAVAKKKKRKAAKKARRKNR